MKLTTWIKVEKAGGKIRRKCSNCDYMSTLISPKWNYCPSCGAKVIKKGATDGKVFIAE